MHPDRTHRPLHFLALGLAGVCLTVGSLEFLPWLPLGLMVYLLVLMAAHHYAGRVAMSEWVANVLGVLIAAGAITWVFLRSGDDDWTVEVPLPAALVPYIGPVLMALLCVRLFRPRSPADFWLLQGLGLLQVVLGCVLATNTLFGVALLAYLFAASSAISAYERHIWVSRSGLVPEPDPAPSTPGWLGPTLGWGVGTLLFGLLAFLLSPRLDQPAWDPLTRFGLQRGQQPARTGFSEDMDLNHGTTIAPDDAVAFTLDVEDLWGQPSDALSTSTRFRGTVLNHYDQGKWHADQHTRRRVQLHPQMPSRGTELVITYRVPRRVGGLFAAEPLHLSDTSPGALPFRIDPNDRKEGGLFYEVNGTIGTSISTRAQEYRYQQFYDPTGLNDRTALMRTSDLYMHTLLFGVPTGMEEVTRRLLLRLGPNEEQWRREVLASPMDLSPKYWERAARLLNDHLSDSREYRYSLSMPGAAKGTDPTLAFLTEFKEGPCQLYASALVLMLRAAGVPGRVVKGYRWAERAGAGHYVVRQNAAHAWAEVVVANQNETGYDWLMLDPTPTLEEEAPSMLLQWWQKQGLGGQKFWRELIINYNGDKQKLVLEQLATASSTNWLSWAGLVGLGLLVAVVGLRMVRRYLRRAAPGAASLYKRLVKLLRGRGLVPEPGETPGEFAARASLALPNAVAAIPGEVVALYYRARYGGVAEDAAELRQAGERLTQLERGLG